MNIMNIFGLIFFIAKGNNLEGVTKNNEFGKQRLPFCGIHEVGSYSLDFQLVRTNKTY